MSFSQQPGFLGAKPAPTNLFGNTTSQSSGGGLFGTTPANKPGAQSLFGNTNTTPSTTGGQTTSSSFSLPKPAEQGGTQQPPSSAFFSQPNATPGFSSTTSTTGLFGTQKSTNNATTPVSGGGLFGGSGLFGKPTTATGATTLAASLSPSAAAPSAPAKDASSTSGNIFGTLAGTPKLAEAKSNTLGTTGNLGLFGAPKTDEKRDEPKGPQPFTLGQATMKEGERALGPALAPKPDAVAVAPPSMLRGKTIEEIVNRWSSELETYVKEFNKFAGEVAVWDRGLIENSKNIAALHSHVSAAEREQNDINQSLDHIEQQQKDLANTLDAYEKIALEILGGQGAGLRALDTGPADTERDKNYMLATDLHTQLDDLSSSLSQMIDSVNALSLPGDATSTDDPMSQIAQILSNHLESLQWIDGAVREVDSKVVEVEKRIKDSGISMSTGFTSKARGFGVNR
ncbi:hypothetical protein APHAL10511_001970 [Amanita phalloides]|nr:hypothetical protein APHAL10511_001970 [Amanita phalloides]